MLANKKVYVGKHSKEIQKKAFKLGWKWLNSNTEISYSDVPFLFFHSDKYIMIDRSVDFFNDHNFEEVTPEWILNLPEPEKIDKTWKVFGNSITGFFVDKEKGVTIRNSSVFDGRIFKTHILPSRELAESCDILPTLLWWRDKYNKGWKPDWTVNIYKYTIVVIGGELSVSYSQRCSSLFAFKTSEIRDKFLEDFREELEIVKSLL